MTRTRTYADYLRDILEAATYAQEFVAATEINAFERNHEKIYAVTRDLEIIGEATRHIPLEMQNRYPHVPWRDMVGMRNVVIHGYFGVDPAVLWRTVREDLPPLCTAIAQILDEQF